MTSVDKQIALMLREIWDIANKDKRCKEICLWVSPDTEMAFAFNENEERVLDVYHKGEDEC
jgi:hypothetical protein